MYAEVYRDSQELHIYVPGEGKFRGLRDSGPLDLLEDVIPRCRPPFEARFEGWTVREPGTWRGRPAQGRVIVLQKGDELPITIDFSHFGFRVTPGLLRILGRHFTLLEDQSHAEEVHVGSDDAEVPDPGHAQQGRRQGAEEAADGLQGR